MKKEKREGLIVIAIFGLILIYISISQNRLNHHGIILQAHTLQWGGASGVNMILQYEFEYKGQYKMGTNAVGGVKELKIFEDKYFPLMYDTVLGTCRLLIRPIDFKRFNLPYPDSLNWVLRYLEK